MTHASDYLARLLASLDLEADLALDLSQDDWDANAAALLASTAVAVSRMLKLMAETGEMDRKELLNQWIKQLRETSKDML